MKTIQPFPQQIIWHWPYWRGYSSKGTVLDMDFTRGRYGYRNSEGKAHVYCDTKINLRAWLEKRHIDTYSGGLYCVGKYIKED